MKFQAADRTVRSLEYAIYDAEVTEARTKLTEVMSNSYQML